MTDSKLCAHCGDAFLRPRAMGSDPWRVRQFCSRTCYNATRDAKRPVATCEGCGASFAQVGDGRFCSRDCYLNHRPTLPVRERFLAKVDEHGPVLRPELGPCHVWTGAHDQNGYGTLNIDGTPVRAHRVAFFLEHGRWPEPCALHHCDGGEIGCVRTDHIYEGDHARNSRDMVERARLVLPGLAGEQHPQAKLTENAVRSIRARFAAGDSLKILAEVFGVSRDNVGLIVRRKAWKHVA